MHTNNDETDLCAVASASFSMLKVTADGNVSVGSKRPFTSTRRAIAINIKIIILHPKSFKVRAVCVFSLSKQRVGHRKQRDAVPLFGGELFEYGLDDLGRVGLVDAVHLGGARLEVGGRVAAENAGVG